MQTLYGSSHTRFRTPVRPAIPRGWYLLAALTVSLAMWAGIVVAFAALL